MSILGAIVIIGFIYILIKVGILGVVLNALFSAIGTLLGLLGNAIGNLIGGLISGIVSGIVSLLGIIAIPAIIVVGCILIIRMIKFTFFTQHVVHRNDYYVASSPIYIGNKKSKIVHYAYDDAASKISPHHCVYFTSLSEALERGYRPNRNL